MMIDHELKIWPEHFEPTIEGVKKAELRKNDRDFRENQMIKLREWDPGTEEYTGRCAYAKITHVTSAPPIPEGWVLLSLTRP